MINCYYFKQEFKQAFSDIDNVIANLNKLIKKK